MKLTPGAVAAANRAFGLQLNVNAGFIKALKICKMMLTVVSRIKTHLCIPFTHTFSALQFASTFISFYQHLKANVVCTYFKLEYNARNASVKRMWQLGNIS